MKKIILAIATIAIVFLGVTSVSSSEKEPVIIDFPDGHQVKGYVLDCELDLYKCSLKLSDGKIYTVMYTQIDDLSKVIISPDVLDYFEHIYPQA
ncbi:hypothetical protein Si036_00400 [Streptococcus infantarius subsp. infantarius]|nr:hypothetical protein [Streptococcus infantarius subsp. infantarius]